VNITVELPGVTLGVIEADDIRVEPANADLARAMNEVCARLRHELTLEQVAPLPSVRDVRAVFRAWGVDPSRYRPSAEALLRRVVQGKGLYPVSNVVDVSNLGSVETGWPYGTYDRAALTPPVALRLGRAGETYEGIGKRTWHLEGRPVLVDAAGPFGSPISDSTRTMVSEETRVILTVIFAPSGTPSAALVQAVERYAERLRRFAGTPATRTAVVGR